MFQEALEGHGSKVSLRPFPYRNCALFGLPGPYDQHIRDLLHLRVAYFLAQFLIPRISLDPDVRIPELFGNPSLSWILTD